MHLVISGQDRSSDLGAELRQAGQLIAHGSPSDVLTPETRWMALQQTRTQAEYDAWFQRYPPLVASRLPIKPLLHARPGAAGALLLRARVVARKLAQGWLHGRKPPEVGSDIGALTLAQATSESDFNERLIRLLKHRDNMDAGPFLMPRKPGFVGATMARLRIFIWQVLRFQVDRIAFRQNHINTLLTRALEFEHEERRRETEALKKKVAELEARLN